MNKSLMNISLWVSIYLLFATPVLAGVNVKSELSHAAGGALLAGVITGTVADRYWSKHRAAIGFTVSTALSMIGEGIEMADGEKFSSSLIDVVAHTAGSMIGAAITDRCILMPILERDSAGNNKTGMVIHLDF